MHPDNFSSFRRHLLDWFDLAKRELPWRQTSDPYRILVSEIMLQQTRVAAVIPYYQRFLDRFPTVMALATSSEQDLLAAWSGLGYYSRARNLQKAAQQIVQRGSFPKTDAELRDLRGIGDYTAAAVASIAFQRPNAAVDGNVLRVISRLWNDSSDISSQTTKKLFAGRAEALLDRDQPGNFNQAMMELGATICLPRQPQCLLCPVSSACAANANATQSNLPVKLAKTAYVNRLVDLAVISTNGRLLLQQRGQKEPLMAGFWEFPELNLVQPTNPPTLVGEVRHSITHYRLRYQIWKTDVSEYPVGATMLEEAEWGKLPLTTVARKAIGLLQKSGIL